MRYSQLQVFVSSRMEELQAERNAGKRALDVLHVMAWAYEDDAGAQSRSPEDSYREALREADLFIGLFWKGYGQHTFLERALMDKSSSSHDLRQFVQRLETGQTKDRLVGYTARIRTTISDLREQFP